MFFIEGDLFMIRRIFLFTFIFMSLFSKASYTESEKLAVLENQKKIPIPYHSLLKGQLHSKQNQ